MMIHPLQWNYLAFKNRWINISWHLKEHYNVLISKWNMMQTHTTIHKRTQLFWTIYKLLLCLFIYPHIHSSICYFYTYIYRRGYISTYSLIHLSSLYPSSLCKHEEKGVLRIQTKLIKMDMVDVGVGKGNFCSICNIVMSYKENHLMNSCF